MAYNNFLRKMTDGNLLVDLQQCKTFEENGTTSNSEHPAEIEITSFSFKLCLQLYSDDFEPSNLIGSRKSIHKVTCFYWILKNLPPWLNSQINQVNVVALCNTLDLWRYGYKPVLDKISDDLKKLERPFNVLTKGGSTISVLSLHFSFVADNAEYQSALGFVKNFAKVFCCERCFVSAENFSNYLIESSCPIRKVSSFERHFQRAQSTRRPSKGVKGKCYLETSYFSSYRNWTTDIQHFLTFRLRDLKDHSIRGKSDQIFTLFRFLPLIICDLIPEVNEHWQFLLQYFELVNLLLSPSFLESDLAIMSHQISKQIIFFVRSVAAYNNKGCGQKNNIKYFCCVNFDSQPHPLDRAVILCFEGVSF